MKIIAAVNSDRYIVEISTEEIAHVFDKWQIKETPIKEIRVGNEIRLDQGYIFRDDIVTACNKMAETIKEFKEAQDTLFKFSTLISESSTKEPT